jgi:translation initiation factor 3 subunit A
MANYFQKLSQIFWVSDNYLFHAFASQKYFFLAKAHNKGLTEEESKMYALLLQIVYFTSLASGVLLSSLAVPLESTAPGEMFELDVEREKSQKMAALFSTSSVASTVPNRQALIDEIVSIKHALI